MKPNSSEQDLNTYTVAQLKHWLHAIGLNTAGNKSELVLRLMEVPAEQRGAHPDNRIASSSSEAVAPEQPFVAGKARVETCETEESCASIKNDGEEKNENKPDSGGSNNNADDNADNDDNEKRRTADVSANTIEGGNVDTKSDKEKTSNYELKLIKKELKLLEKEMELQKRENATLKRENELLKKETQSGENRSVDNLNHIKGNFICAKDFLAEFSGSDDCFEHWETQLRSVQTAFYLDENNMRALISNKLKGKALKWLHSKSDLMTVPVDDLLSEMRTLFEDRSSRLTLKRQFEERVWLTTEAFKEYFHDKLILANKIKVNDDELLEHFIEGISIYILRSQAKMQRFRSKQQLLEAFSDVRLEKSPLTSFVKPITAQRPETSNEKQPTRVLQKGALNDKQPSMKVIRCYNCNSIEHMAGECRKPKREIGAVPSELLFGVGQRGVVIDFLKERLEDADEREEVRDLEGVRTRAADKIVKCQNYNKKLKDRGRIERTYDEGDYVVVKNFISTPGACKKMAPKFKGPYRVAKVLPNDRYLLRDVEGFQLTQIPYEGIWEVANMKPWINDSKRNKGEIGTIASQDGRTVATLYANECRNRKRKGEGE